MNGHVPFARRIVFLDSLRGVALSLVVLYHGYYRWSGLLPSGHAYPSNFLFRSGWVGVNLFFLISGFVILMTLEKCGSLSEFLYRRWTRLFPAMLACSLIVYITAPLVPERPMGSPVLRDLLPGLTFIEPGWWEALLGSKQGVLEGSFWSLFVEFKFYVVFGAMFFCFGKKAALISLAIIDLLASRLTNFIVTNTHPSGLGFLHETAAQLGGQYFGFFLAGALLYLYFHRPSRNLIPYIALSFGLAIAEYKGSRLLPVLLVLATFAAAVTNEPFQRALSQRFLLFMGFISYPLYLLHENLMVGLSIKLDRWANLPGIILPVLPAILLVAVSWFIASYVEPWLRRRLRDLPAFRKPIPSTI